MDKKPMFLSELITATESKLTALMYTFSSKKAITQTFRLLQEFANKCGIFYYSAELSNRFFNECCINSTRHLNIPLTDETKKRKLNALRHLSRVYENDTIVKGQGQLKPPLSHYYEDIMEKHNKWLVKQNYAKNTKIASSRTTRQFIDYLVACGIDSIGEITANHISGYVVTHRGHAPATMKGDLGRLRIFMRFLFFTKLTAKNLAELVPEFHYGNERRLESNIWSKEELAKVLNSIDRGSPVGKRDYAVCLLATDLGIRNSDITALKLNDIKWDIPCAITFIQSKTKKANTLPLPERVGLAIIDYLKYGRPKTECQNVFVKHIPPYDALSRFSSMFYQRVAESGIPKKYNRKYGLHSLRHTVATRMLESGVEFDKIAPFLGHSDANSLHIYLNYDIEHLRQCALSFEEEV